MNKTKNLNNNVKVFFYFYLMKRHLFIPLLFISFFNFAQSNLSESEIDLIKLSIEKSHTLKEASHELSIDSIESKTIRQNFIPTLELNAVYGYGSSRINVDIPSIPILPGFDLFAGETRFNASGQVFNSNLTAKALLFSGLQVNYGSKASKEKIKAKNFMLNATKSEIIKDVVDTFNMIELLHKSETVILASEQRLAKEKERVEKAIENGLAIPYDRQKITAAELNLSSKKAELYGTLSLLYMKLSILTNVDIATLKDYKFELKPWLLQSTENSFSDRPELKALEASISAYDYKLKMNRNAFLPKIQAFATLSYANLFDANINTSLPLLKNTDFNLNKFEMFPAYMLGVGMQWEIFNGLKHSNEAEKTAIEKNIAEDKKTDAEEKLELYAKKVQVDFEVKNQQLLFKEQEKEVAYNTLTLAIKSYHEGLISITDRLEAETDYQEAALNYYKLIAQQRMAALDLLISTGSLQVENLNH